MAIPETEVLLTLTEARRLMPHIGGKHPSLTSIWRWCRRGLRGVRLEYVRVGRSLATSKEALNRFFNALAAADEELLTTPQPPRVPRRVSSTRAASLTMANRILDRAGI